jgi:hypothetical protein
VRRCLPALLLLVLACALASPVRAGDPPGDGDARKKPDAGYPAQFRAAVNQAIDRGRDGLLRTQQADGTWRILGYRRDHPMGTTALAVLTLLKCGVPPTDPHVQKAFAFLRGQPMRATYSVALLLMALDARYAPARDPFAVEEVDRYGLRTQDDPCAQHIDPKDLAWMRKGVAFLTDNQNADGVWRYPQGGFDLSNTQYAILGLHAAARCGVRVKAEVWRAALRHVLGFQQKDGEPVLYKANEVRGRYRFEWTERAIARGFGYTTGDTRPTASMTTAGLTVLVICQQRLWRARGFGGRERAEVRRGVRDAMAWLQVHFAVDTNPGGADAWHFYYLYGLERAGVLGRFRFLGTHDWYREGAELLVSWQEPDGSWPTPQRGVDTCFALLFLKRATSRMRAPVITPRAGGHAERAAAPGRGAPAEAEPREPRTVTERLVAVARALHALRSEDADEVFLACKRLGALGHLRAVRPLVEVLARHEDPDVRTAAAHALGVLEAADAVPALIAALRDGDVLVRWAAQGALQSITGNRFGPGLRGTRDRGDLVRLQKTWRDWWNAHEEAVRARLRQPRGD